MPGQHVAGAGGGEQRRAVAVDRGAAVGRGNHRVRPLVDDDRVGHRGRLPRSVELRQFGSRREVRKQPAELALMRRQHQRRAPRPTAPLRRTRRGARQARSTHRRRTRSPRPIRPPRRSGRAQSAPTFACVPSPGPNTSAPGFRARHELGHVVHRFGLLQDDRRQMRRIYGKRIGRRKQRHRPCPGTRRGHRRQPRRAGRGRPAGKHADMAARIFVGVERRRRQSMRSQLRRIVLDAACVPIDASTSSRMPMSATMVSPQ